MILPVARRSPRGRSGITLMEILISILIMGVGLVSLATLFPLGLMRIKSASDYSRSALLTESARDELGVRSLLNLDSFRSLYGYSTGGLAMRNPFILDTTISHNGQSLGAVFRGLRINLPFARTDAGFSGTIPAAPGYDLDRPGPGLPVALDPLWWSLVRYSDATVMPAHNGLYANLGAPLAFQPSWHISDGDARFGSGIGSVRDNAGGVPGAKFGLQRLTNFIPFIPGIVPYSTAPFTYPVNDSALSRAGRDMPGEIFTSPDDLILQRSGANADVTTGVGSPIVPDLSGSVLQNDLVFTWMLTGQLADANDGTTFEGNVVVHRNRQFAFDPVLPSSLPATPGAATRVRAPAGERAIEAIFGYSAPVGTGAFNGYVPSDGRIILLRWPADQPDPDVRVGGWIADVTYQQSLAADAALYRGKPYSGQRCYWYQVIRRTDPEQEVAGVTAEPALDTYRRMAITVATPVKARTLWVNSVPLVETALIANSVVNVFPRTFTIK